MQLNEEEVNTKSREKNHQMNYQHYSGKMMNATQIGQMAQTRGSAAQGASGQILKQSVQGNGSVKQTPVSVEKQALDLQHE